MDDPRKHLIPSLPLSRALAFFARETHTTRRPTPLSFSATSAPGRLLPIRVGYSQYGYVRPDRVSLDRGTSDKVRPPVVSSPARLPARTAKTCRRTTTQDGGNHVSEGESSGGAVPAGRSSAAAAGGLEEARHVQVDSSFSQQQQRGKGYDGGDGLNAGNAGAAGRSDYAAGRDTGVSGDDDQGGQLSAEAATATATHRRGTGEMEEQEEAEVAHTDGGVSGRGAVTPARPALGVREGRQQEEEPFSPPTPESPGLADWEITEVRWVAIFLGGAERYERWTTTMVAAGHAAMNRTGPSQFCVRWA